MDACMNFLVNTAKERSCIQMVYIFAVLPCAMYTLIDHIDGFWRKISILRFQTYLGLAVCCSSCAALLLYFVGVWHGDNPTEGMATVMALVAAATPLGKLSRQLLLLGGSTEMGRLLDAVPRFGYSFRGDFGPASGQEGGLWDPGNSSNIFDNDRPGSGVSDLRFDGYIGLCGAAFQRWLGRVVRRPPHPRVHEPTWKELRKLLSCGERYSQAEAKAVFDLRIMTDMGWLTVSIGRIKDKGWIPGYDAPGRLIGIKGQNAMNCLAKSAWLFENLTGPSWLEQDPQTFESVRGPMAHLLHLGLVVHVGVAMVQRRKDLVWVETLTGVRGCKALGKNFLGHIQQYGPILQLWFPDLDRACKKQLEEVDFQAAFARLPPDHCGMEKAGLANGVELQWQELMFIASSTIELHAFVRAISGTLAQTTSQGQNRAFGAVETGIIKIYVLAACVMNEYKGPETLGKVVSEWENRYDDLKATENNWENIVRICGKIADIVTRAMHRTVTNDKEQAKEMKKRREELEKIVREVVGAPETINKGIHAGVSSEFVEKLLTSSRMQCTGL